MYLSRFGVKNYKCLGDIDFPLTPIHVLIGQNDCGKTSLLEAMAAFFATSKTDTDRLFPEPWSGHELVRHGSSGTGIELWGEWTSSLSDDGDLPHRSFRFGLLVDFPSRVEQACTLGDEWIETGGEKRSFHASGSYGPGPLGEDNLAVSKVLRPAHKYALDANAMALPACFDRLRKFRLDSDGFGLATLLDDILSFNPKVFLAIQEEFCHLFPQFQSVRLSTEYGIARTMTDGLPESIRGTGKGIYLEMQSGQTVRARHASDGVILFLGLLALSHLPEPPGLLLLEEPENGVYPLRLKQIITLLREMTNRAEGPRFPQIILTTHSPYVLSFFEPEEVTLLSRPSGSADAPVRARPLRDVPDIKKRLAEDQLYLGELWYNFTEEELFGDA
jgi:hypothetical protein